MRIATSLRARVLTTAGVTLGTAGILMTALAPAASADGTLPAAPVDPAVAPAAPVEPAAAPAAPAAPAATLPVAAAPVSVAVVARIPATAKPATLTPAQRAAAARKAKEARATAMRLRVAAIARSKVGARYRAGAAGPRAFDCSGLVQWAVRKATGRVLPHYSRAQFAMLKKIPLSQAKPGDLVFFFRHGAHHAAIYIGGGRMVGAANPRKGVRIDRVLGPWYGSHFSGAARVV